MKRRPRSTQSCACCSRPSASTSIGVWLTTLSSALWLQTSHSSGATLKSPTIRVGSSSVFGPARHALDEVELLAELGIELAVGNVAAGGDVDVLQPDPAVEPRRRCGAPRHCPASRARPASRSGTRLRIATPWCILWPLSCVMDVAEPAEQLGREDLVGPWSPAGTGCRAAPPRAGARRCRCAGGPN